MENLTIGFLKEELEHWPELVNYTIEVDGQPLKIDNNGNCFQQITGDCRSVSLIINDD